MMRLIPLSLVVIGLMGCSSANKSSSAAGTTQTNYSSASSKGGFRLRPYKEKTLANGLRMIFVEDASLPYISYSLMLKSGHAEDPEGFPGLSNLVSELLDKGSSKRSATQLADDLALLGAEFSSSVTPDYTIASSSTLSNHAEDLLKIFSEIVMEPSFTETEVDRLRKQVVAALEKQIDNPSAFIDVAWEDFLYGSHPYGKPALGNLKSIKAIKRKNIIQHYLRTYRPNNAYLAVVGKYTPELEKSIEAVFSKWESRDVQPPKFQGLPQVKGIQVRLVDKPGLVQSQVRLGHPGIKRQDEDFLALRVANTILGGAFASRLNDRIRKDLGLTYSISSGFDARLDIGPFEVGTFTKNSSVGQVVSESLKVLKEFRENGVTSAEMDRAKGYLKGIFPTAIETAEKLAQNLLILRLYGIPDSYLTNYIDNVDDISTSEVNRAIKKHINEQNIKVVVYSSAGEVLPQLQVFGQVEVKPASELQ